MAKIVINILKVMFCLAVIVSIVDLMTLDYREDYKSIIETGTYEVIEKHIGTRYHESVVYIVFLKKVGSGDYRAVTNSSAKRYAAFKIGGSEELKLEQRLGMSCWEVVEELKAEEASDGG